MASCKLLALQRLLGKAELINQFTISSAPEDPFISVHIRQVGDFTTALGERLGATPDLHRLDSGKKGGRGEKNGFVEVDSGLGGERAVEVGPGMDRGMPKLRIDG